MQQQGFIFKTMRTITFSSISIIRPGLCSQCFRKRLLPYSFVARASSSFTSNEGQAQKQDAPKEKHDFNKLAWNSLAAFGVSAFLLLAYFQYTQYQLDLKKQAAKNESVGKPVIGGPFVLTDHFGNKKTNEDYKGKFVLIYFGYTFCPDVCPEELEKIGKVVNTLDEDKDVGRNMITPLFVSCDPRRDTPEIIKNYLAEYHPKFIGLTGSYDQIKQCAKNYRFYFSAPPKALQSQQVDYLVDHSIFFYLLDPEGKYVAHFGRSDTADDVSQRVKNIILQYRSTHLE